MAEKSHFFGSRYNFTWTHLRFVPEGEHAFRLLPLRNNYECKPKTLHDRYKLFPFNFLIVL